MNLILQPNVYLASVQHFVDDAQGPPDVKQFLVDNRLEFDLELGNDFKPADKIPELAGRLCYMSFNKPRPGGNEAYLKHIKEERHGSVLEHTVFSFVFTGVSRALSHELVRHRSGFSYSQLSQRYVDSSDVDFVVPLELQTEVTLANAALTGFIESQLDRRLRSYGDNARELLQMNQDTDKRVKIGLHWIISVSDAVNEYREFTNYLHDRIMKMEYADIGQTALTQEERTNLRKRARQTARSVLPNCTETKLYVTANARAWRHFIEQRCAKTAESEIRILAGMVHQVLNYRAPGLFGDYEKVELPDGTFELTTSYKKV